MAYLIGRVISGCTHIVDVRDKLPLRRVPSLLLSSPQLRLDVEQLYLQVGTLRVPAEEEHPTIGIVLVNTVLCLTIYSKWRIPTTVTLSVLILFTVQCMPCFLS